MSGPYSMRVCVVVLAVLGTAMAASVQKRWATSYDQPFSYQCPLGQALSFIHSQHHNHHEDRLWDFQCKPVAGAGNCRISHPANVYDGVMNFQCPRGEVLAGMTGVHSNYREDRIFKFICCQAQVQVSNCVWTRDLNNYDGPVYYRLSGDKIFHGVHSRHSNHHEDRIWRFEVCDTN